MANFAVSTHLYHSYPLAEDQLREVASYGFDAVELFATRGHFDYHDKSAIAELGKWLDSAGVELHSVHAPIVEKVVGTHWGEAYNSAATHQAVRQQAVAEAIAALEIARTVPYKFLVFHLGVPAWPQSEGADNDRLHAMRSVEQVHEAAAGVGVQLALEVIPNTLSTAESLVRMIEDDLELRDVGICLDFGHAFLMGDLLDAIETVSGHLLTTHVHDNRGKSDDHLAPFDGRIDWLSALMSVQKVGYEGRLLFELQSQEPARTVLERAASVRRRFEQILYGDCGPLALDQ